MLRELQYGFRRSLLGQPDSALATAVIGDGLDPQARLRVYRNHVVISLREALRATFPVVCRLVGDDFFAGMARTFVSAHPPESPCLHEYGEALAEFIEGFAPAATLPYLADVARLEWALNVAYHAPLAPPLAAAALAAVDPADLAQSTLRLQPSLRVLLSAFPVDAIWRANRNESDAPVVELDAGGCALLVWREADDAAFRAVDRFAAGFVTRLLAGETLGSALEHCQEADAAFDPGLALGILLAAGLIAGVGSDGTGTAP